MDRYVLDCLVSKLSELYGANSPGRDARLPEGVLKQALAEHRGGFLLLSRFHETPMIPSDSPHARMFDLCGDHMATIALERLVYWWRRGTRRQLSGSEWLCKPRGQLARECRMSEHELRRAIDKLKAGSLVEITAAKWAGSVGPVMHFRLLPQAMVLLERPARGFENAPSEAGSVVGKIANNLDHMGGIGSKNPYGFSNENPTEFLDADALSTDKVSGKDEVVVTGGILPKKSKKIPGSECVNSSPKKSTPKAPSPVIAEMQDKLGKNAADKKVDGVLAAAKAVKSSSGKPTLAEVWREAYAEAYLNEFQAPLSKQQLGQLKMLASKLQPLDASSVIRKVIADWTGFTYVAAKEAGAFKLSTRPQIGVVLRFVNVAANFKNSVAVLECAPGSGRRWT